MDDDDDDDDEIILAESPHLIDEVQLEVVRITTQLEVADAKTPTDS